VDLPRYSVVVVVGGSSAVVVVVIGGSSAVFGSSSGKRIFRGSSRWDETLLFRVCPVDN
jgi:hypothetical protein